MRIKSFDGIKVIAMIAIFMHHCPGLNEYLPVWKANCAVTLFFMFGGCSAYLYFQKHPFEKYYGFFIHQVAKMWPVYFATLFIAFLLVAYKEGLHINTLLKLLLDALMVQSFFPYTSIYFSLNGVAWFVSSIMLSYFFAKFIITKIKLLHLKSVGVYIFVIIVCEILFTMFVFRFSNLENILSSSKVGGGGGQRWLVYINPVFRMLDFTLGVICMDIRQRMKGFGKSSAIELIVIILFIVWYQYGDIVPPQYLYGAYWIVVFMLIIFVFSFDSGLISRFLGNGCFSKLNKLSLEFFLIHQIVLSNLRDFVTVTQNKVYWILCLIISLAFSYLLSNLRAIRFDKNKQY